MDRWQMGECGTYARVLQLLRPSLRVACTWKPGPDASERWPVHVYAHDGVLAYDSLGRHRMPYRVPGNGDLERPAIGRPGRVVT